MTLLKRSLKFWFWFVILVFHRIFARLHQDQHKDRSKYNLSRSKNSTRNGKCGTKKPPSDVIKILDDQVENMKKQNKSFDSKSYVFDVYFHVLSSSTTKLGDVDDQQIFKQMKVLNEAFEGSLNTYGTDCFNNPVQGRNTSISFKLRGVNHVRNTTWFFSSTEDIEFEYKKNLRKGSCSTLNVYTAGVLESGYFAWAFDPSSCKNWPVFDGIVIDYKTLPDGSCCDDAEVQGDTLVHEVGHWLGLHHTFEGGCTGLLGDHVRDTPPQEKPSIGCPIYEKENSCSSLFKKFDDFPIHNYMDYSDDCCMYEFTEGQIKRMHASIEGYRSGNEYESFVEIFLKSTYDESSCMRRLCENSVEWATKCKWKVCSGCPLCSDMRI